MRYGLISLEDVDAAQGGALAVAGRSVYRWQASLAQAAGCERVLCWTPREVAAPLALQKEIEGRGSRFQPVGDLHRLARIVGPGDELLIFSPGFMIDEAQLVAFVEGGPAIATIPADDSGDAGFDRIDLTRLSAGLMFVPGALVTQLADLPDDCDPGGSLLRIALQSRVPTRSLVSTEDSAPGFRVVRRVEDARLVEDGWFERSWHSSAGARRTLTRVVTDRLGRRLARDPRAPGFALGATALGAVASLGLAVAGWPSAGLGVLALTSLAGESWRRLRGTSMSPRAAAPPRFARGPGMLVDLLLAAILAIGLTGWTDAAADRIFLAVTLVLALRLADRDWGAAFADRPVAAILLCIGAGLGVLAPVTQAIVLLCLGASLAISLRHQG